MQRIRTIPKLLVIAEIVLFGLAAGTHNGLGEVRNISSSEEANLIRHLLPLPHKVAIKKAVVIPPEDVGITLRKNAGEAEINAVAQLRRLFKEKANVPAAGNKFEILVGVLDKNGAIDGVMVENAEELKNLPNSDQAYLVRPAGENRLIVAALNEKGVFYGITTLSQLVEAGISREKVAIPLASITDWPDFAERGFWHMKLDEIPWLTSLKFNRFHVHAYFRVLPGKIIEPYINTLTDDKEWADPYKKARAYAAEVTPGITHLDHWLPHCQGFAAAFPELTGKGERSKAGVFEEWGARGLCATDPQLGKILGAIMKDLASRGAAEMTVWMSEYAGTQCECEKCIKAGQFQSEVRASLDAWNEARKTYPELRLNVFFGAGGQRPHRNVCNYPPAAIGAIIDSLPAEVGLCASMGMGDALKRYARKGGRAINYAPGPQPTYWDIFNFYVLEDKNLPCAFTNRYYGFYQYIRPLPYKENVMLLDLPVSILAEYAWNVKGRNINDFAEAWATRHKISNPQKFARLAAIMAAVEAQPLRGFVESRGGWLAQMPGIVSGKKKTGFFDSIDPEKNAAIIRRCEQALEIAKDVSPEEYYNYIKTVLCYYRLENAALAFVNAALESKGEKQALQLFGAAMAEFIDAYSARLASIKKSNPSLYASLRGAADQMQRKYKEIKLDN